MSKNDDYQEVIPTLFIGLGGSGAEVLWRIRQRILDHHWQNHTQTPSSINNLADFPFAEFLHIDTDHSFLTENLIEFKSGYHRFKDEVLFKKNEQVIKKLDVQKYFKTDGELAKYPNIEEWFPLNPSKINELSINPDQIRCLSRLYLFDHYAEIKTAINVKLNKLLSDISRDETQAKFGFMGPKGGVNIVVVASTEGGTGSGCFIDLGYLSKIIVRSCPANMDAAEIQEAIILNSLNYGGTDNGRRTVNLNLILPRDYEGERNQANTYAALMELETCMRQGTGHVKGWSENEVIRDFPDKPYDNVNFIGAGNVAIAKTKEISDIYDMVAGSLFDSLTPYPYCQRIVRIRHSQNQHKITPYISRVVPEIYGDMKLTFSRGYSSFGQSTIDTHLEQKQNVVVFKQVNEMLKAFFGVSADKSKVNIPTEQERDDLLKSRLSLGYDNEILDYDFVVKSDEFKKGAERTTFPIITELLRVGGISRLDDIENKITATFEEIRNAGSEKEWETKLSEAIRLIDNDVFQGVEAGSGLHNEGIKRRRIELLTNMMDSSQSDGLIKALWARVDNKEKGGLDYTIELIQRIKDRLENPNTGLAKALKENGKWYADLAGHIRNKEVDKLKSHLAQAVSMANVPLIGNKDLPAVTLKHISEAVRMYVHYSLYASASKEAATLIQEIANALGTKTGTDAEGEPTWNGFIGELEEGRQLVKSIIADSENQIARNNEALKQKHAMYFVLPAPKSKIEALEMITPTQAQAWAEEAFEDFGGTEELFSMLLEDDGRAELLGKLRNRALAFVTSGENKDDVNPLFTALDSHPNRSELFGKFLQRAMPWVPSTLDKYLKSDTPEDQYKCYIGVKGAKEFEAKYGNEFKSKMPSNALITTRQLAFVEIDQPGKLVCYTELTGFPIASLKSLDDWYGSYRTESAKLPVHTHKRTSTFVHPRELTTDELDAIAEDMKLFIEAVALGVLKRVEKGSDEGVYQLAIKGSKRNVGDEKLLRLNGFDKADLATIAKQVDSDLAELKSKEQIALWCALIEHYKNSVYPLRLIGIDGVVDEELKALPSLICERIVNESYKKLQAVLGNEDDAERCMKSARESLFKHTEEVPGSMKDVYPYEVNMDEILPKRVLNYEVLSSKWGQSVDKASMPSADPSSPPPPPNEAQYHFMVGQQQFGPYGLQKLQTFVQSGQLNLNSYVWQIGLPNWVLASTLPELLTLLSNNNPK